MNAVKQQEQGINTLSQADYLPILISSFLIDRQSQGFAAETVTFYRKKLKYFGDFYEGQAVTQISQPTPDQTIDPRTSDCHNDGKLFKIQSITVYHQKATITNSLLI